MKKAVRRGHTNPILIHNSQSFLRFFARDISRAKRRVYIQTLSFEGDRAGKAIARLLKNARVPDRRIIIDSYTLWCLSDHVLFAPHNWLRPSLWFEWFSTRRMLGDLKREGYRIRFVRPPVPTIRKMAGRNHKKLILIDDTCYVGGLNLSDHNFDWQDMMVRFENPKLADFFASDFEITWSGGDLIENRRIGNLDIQVLDGRSNEDCLKPVLEAVASAGKSVHVVCPYMTSPFLDAVFKAGEQGAIIHILVPQNNNRKFLKAYIHHRVRMAKLNGCRVRLYEYPHHMIHMKAIVLDRRELLFGSANFDFMCYRVQPEYVLTGRDPVLVKAFFRNVWEPFMRASREVDIPEESLRGPLSTWMVRFFDRCVARWGANAWFIPEPGNRSLSDGSVSHATAREVHLNREEKHTKGKQGQIHHHPGY